MIETVAQMVALKPSAGFTWVGTRLTYDGNANKYSSRIALLYSWAKTHGIGLTPTGDYIYCASDYHDVYVYSNFNASVKNFEETVKHFGTGTFVGPCGHTHKIGEWACTLRGHPLVCTSCYKGGINLKQVGRSFLCSQCYDMCTKCHKEPVYLAQRSKYAGDAKTQCETCCPIFRCNGCSNYASEKDGKYEVKWNDGTINVCEECKVKVCDVCNKWSGRAKPVIIEGKRHCKACATKVADRERVKYEKFSSEELPKTGTIVVPTLPERPFRPISIETEVDGDKDYIGQTLYNCGIVRVPAVESYGTYTPEKSHWPAFLKHDGSVTGGELISYLLQLDKSDHADAFLNTLAKVRSLAKVGKVQFNSNCGGHIHIDAHNFDSGNVWRLLTVWNFLEDVIYRLAGAGHSYGHRTLDKQHDRANHGRGYANTPAKGPWGVKSAASRAWQTQDRMCGLNFKPYIGAVGSCTCGAAAKDRMRECTCTLPKCTIEWRVWNTQGNPRILHAWIAFMQAMHAYADVDEEPTAEFEEAHPTLAWKLSKFGDTDAKHQEAVKERLEWIFGNLVLTDDERDSLIYAIKQSDMKGLGTYFIESLRKVEGPKDVAPRKHTPRTVRVTKILVKKPSQDADFLENLNRHEREQLQYQLGRQRIARW